MFFLFSLLVLTLHVHVGWHVNDAHFNHSQDHLIVASYSNPVLQEGTESGESYRALMGAVCIWNARVLFDPNM